MTKQTELATVQDTVEAQPSQVAIIATRVPTLSSLLSEYQETGIKAIGLYRRIILEARSALMDSKTALSVKELRTLFLSRGWAAPRVAAMLSIVQTTKEIFDRYIAGVTAFHVSVIEARNAGLSKTASKSNRDFDIETGAYLMDVFTKIRGQLPVRGKAQFSIGDGYTVFVTTKYKPMKKKTGQLPLADTVSTKTKTKVKGKKSNEKKSISRSVLRR